MPLTVRSHRLIIDHSKGNMMLWFRSNIRIGSLGALVVLALQLALTFGHVHADTLFRDNGLRNDASGLISVRLASEAPADQSGVPVAPARRAGVVDFCAICANIDIAGTLLLAAPPGSPSPLATSEALRGSVAGFDLTGTTRGLFRARAPPLA